MWYSAHTVVRKTGSISPKRSLVFYCIPRPYCFACHLLDLHPQNSSIQSPLIYKPLLRSAQMDHIHIFLKGWFNLIIRLTSSLLSKWWSAEFWGFVLEGEPITGWAQKAKAAACWFELGWNNHENCFAYLITVERARKTLTVSLTQTHAHTHTHARAHAHTLTCFPPFFKRLMFDKKVVPSYQQANWTVLKRLTVF